MVFVVEHPALDLPRGWEVIQPAIDPYDGADVLLVRYVLTDLFMLAGEDGRLRPISQDWARRQMRD